MEEQLDGTGGWAGGGGGWQGRGKGNGVIEVARKREAWLFVEGKGASEDVEMDRREKEGANYRDRERN